MTIFSRIINREIPAYIVAEDEHNIAFLDIQPLEQGHVLCIPKNAVDKLFDLPSEDYQALQQFTYRVAQALEKAIPCKRVGMAVLGLEVPHAHIHLVPLQSEASLNFSNPKLELSTEEFIEIQQKIIRFV